MNTKRIVLSAIIAALPFTANAENISGAMYTAPIAPTQQTPAPTASVSAPYGRINIDTDDQEHIATTAYVKGAYNSAIAAVNKVNSNKQNQLFYVDDDSGDETLVESEVLQNVDHVSDLYGDMFLVSGLAVKKALAERDTALANKRVSIYTTWGDDSAKAPVALANINDFN